MSKLYTVARGHGVFRADGSPNTDPVTVPDGKWVVEVYAHSFAEWEDDDGNPFDPFGDSGFGILSWRTNEVVGPEPQIRYTLGAHRNRQHWTGGDSASHSSRQLLVGDQPFGVITEEEREGSDPLDHGGLYFHCARQIHKGELGRRPQIVRPQFVREAPDHFMGEEGRDGQPITARNLRRGKKGWAQLQEVAELVGMDPEEMVRRYYLFTDESAPRLQIMRGGPEVIVGRKIRRDEVEVFYPHAFAELFGDPRQIWIRQGFALTILYLKYFGYEPVLPEEKAAAIALVG